MLVTQRGEDSTAIPSSCDSTQRVAVVTDQAMADALDQKPVDGQSCIQLDVSVEDNSQTALRAASGDLSEPLWIPDSSSRLPAALYDDAVSVHTESLASSPGVIAGQEAGEAPQTWTDALANDATRMGDPDRDGGAHTAVQSVASEVSDGTVDQTRAAEVLTPRAQTQGVNSPILSASEMLGEVTETGGEAIVAESDYLRYRAENPDDQLEAWTPDSGTSFLDYPLLASGDAIENNDAIRTAADEIADWVDSDEGRSALNDAHLRTAGGEIEDGAVSDPARLPEPDEDVWTTVSESYRNQAAPMNALVALDASGSMGTMEANGQTRWDTTVQTLMLGTQLFPARDSMGVWLFSDDLGEDNAPYEELVPNRGMEEGVDGRTQREILQEALAQASFRDGGQTDLYDTALEAFRYQQENYREGQLNIVLLISDGEQEVYTRETMSLEDLVGDLQAEQDPNRPVVIVSLGISPDADAEALTAISEATGGSYHQATTPEELQAAFVEALSANDPTAG